MAALTDCPVGGFVKGQSLNVSQTGKVHDLGYTFRDRFGREHMYVRANGAITGQGYVVSIDASYDATLMTTAILNTYPNYNGVSTTNGAPADNDYCWACLEKPPGDAELGVRVSNAAAADTQLYTTATAGELDDAAGTAPVDGIRLLTAQGSAAGVNTASEWKDIRRGLVGT